MIIINYIINSLFVILTPLVFVKIMLNPEVKKDKSKIIVAILVSIVLSIIMHRYTTEEFKTILSLIIYIILIQSVYKIKLNQTIISVIGFIFIVVIQEGLTIYVIKNIIGISKDYIYNEFAGSSAANIIVFTSSLLLSLILKIGFNKIINKKTNINNKVAIFSVLTFISVIVFFYDIIANYKMNTRIIFYIIAIITFLIALIIVIHQNNKNQEQIIEYNKILEFMETYEKEIETERINKHERDNNLITIKSKIIDNEPKENIIEYIDSLLGEESNISQREYAKLQCLPANGIKGLFYFKIKEAKNKGIKVSVSTSNNIKETILSKLTTKEFKDLGTLIGVYIDNAIEASEKSEKKLLGIEIYKQKQGVKIIISNTYTGSVDNNIGKTHYTTKGQGRGYGLLLVGKTLINNKRFAIEKEITSNLYIQSLLVKNKEIKKKSS